MLQPINITTLDGIRLDVSQSATIEVNMGGISLLSLADRPATYTNSFTLPRTPTNEAVFAFASQPTRNNRPSIDVTISKGLFQRKAILKVLEFDDGYKCSISYDSTAEYLNNLNYYSLFETKNIFNFGFAPNYTQTVNAVFDISNESFALSTNGHSSTGSIFTKLTTFLSLIPNVVFSGDLLTDPDFLNCSILNKHISLDADGTFLKQIVLATSDFLKVSTVIKSICQLFLSDIIIDGNVITLKKINNNGSSLSLEGFSFTKQLYSGNAAINYIKYDIVDKGIPDTFASDFFIGDGVGIKDVVKIGVKMPKYYNEVYGGYEVTDGISPLDIVIMAFGGDGNPVQVQDGGLITALDAVAAEPLTLTGFYSNILNPIFTNPIILEASKWLDPLTANQIMTDRVINSVQLGGRYWVDNMAYDLNSGNSKMKLIKLQ